MCDDIVLTAGHCADENTGQHQVWLYGRCYPAERVWDSGDPAVDLALLRVADALPLVEPMALATLNTETDGRFWLAGVGFPKFRDDGKGQGRA
ncbi:MAG: serine protease, partial [Propionibacteriaceae bacterium]|nr:serine protease [Propionibacteriaceae bacterium]